jgi:hypothetical protein
MEMVGGSTIFAYFHLYGTGSAVFLVRNAVGIRRDGRDMGPPLLNLCAILFHFSSAHMVLFK